MRTWVLGIFLVLASGCGGGDGADNGGGVSGIGGTAGAGADAASDAPPAIGSTVTRVTVRPAGATASAGPVTFAQAFRQGDIPETVVAVVNDELLPTQMDAKRRHGDGSVRHAVITFQAPAMAEGEELEVELRSASSGNDAPGPSVSDLLAGGFDAAVEITLDGHVYTASARDLLESGSPARWLDGALAAELRIDGPLVSGSGPHPALHALFDVRFFGLGGARVSVVVENAYEDTPGNINYDVRVLDAAGGVSFEQVGVEHYHHARWRHVMSWGTPRGPGGLP